MRLTLFLSIIATVGLAVAKAAPEPQSMHQLLSNGMSNFAVDLLKHLQQNGTKSQQNLIFSPGNIYFTLSMLHLGSAGITRSQIAQTLGMPVDDAKVSQIHETIRDILQSIQYEDVKNEFISEKINIANGVFLQKGLELKSSYNADSQKYYDSRAVNLDFKEKGGQAAADTINKWCSDETEGRIPKVFDSLDPSTLLALASALYFKGRWLNEFPKSETKTGKFDNGERTIDVQMMSADETVRYVNETDFKFEAIALNYNGLNFSMGVYLPYVGVSLASLTRNLKPEHLQSVFSANSRPVKYKIPRTKFTRETSLVDVLTSLGLGRIFDKVDLSNMINTFPDSLKISEAKHIAEIEIDEHGTKASAATFLTAVPTSGWYPIVPSIPFYADRPFLLTIQHRPTQTIIFVGTVYQPVENTA